MNIKQVVLSAITSMVPAQPPDRDRRVWSVESTVWRFLLVCIFLLGHVTVLCAQTFNSDRCSVLVQDAVSKRSNLLSMRMNSAKTLGTFDVVAAKDALTSKVYRLPRTVLYVVATVSYENQFLGSEQNPDFLNMRLFVSPKREENLIAGVAYAEAEVPFKALGPGEIDSSAVTTQVKVGGRSIIMITLSCQQQVRH